MGEGVAGVAEWDQDLCFVTDCICLALCLGRMQRCNEPIGVRFERGGRRPERP